MHKRIMQFYTIIVNIIIWYHGDASEILFILSFYTHNILESIIIKITFDENINLNQGIYNTDTILEYFIEMDLKV